VLEKVLEDGIVDEDELRMLLDKFTEFTSPIKTTCYDVNDIKDKHFVLTGEFSYGTRSSVLDFIVSKGGIVDDQVKKCTQFVVIGSLGSQAWKNGVYGSKIKKAMELKDKGQDIELVAEEDFFKK
jgi:NAD-dependent DNA ligase